MKFKTGKLPPKFNPKTLMMARYLTETPVPAPPSKCAWEYAVPDDQWGMMGNDTVGDCTCASKAHQLMIVSANTGSIIIPTTEQVLSMYSSITGYDPSQTQPDGSNPTDNGAAMTDVLDWLTKNELCGHKLEGWVAIDHTNRTHFEQCVNLFSVCDTGVQLPNDAMTQFSAGQPWNVLADDGGADGGHCVPYPGYGSLGETCISWAKRQPCSIDWLAKYCDEAYGLIWDDWFDTNNVAPNHFNKDALWADLQALKH